MTSAYHTWQFIDSCLQRSIPVMLLYVLESRGSSPGRQGFLMAVNERGEMEGSIGGGIMEHKFVDMAAGRLRNGQRNAMSADIRKQIHNKQAAMNQSGMICSGEQTILLYAVQENDKAPVRQLLDSMAKNQNGTLELSPRGIAFMPVAAEKDFEFSRTSGENWYFREKTGYRHQLFIIGGGHCALALSRLMRSLDFYIRVYDDRERLRTMQLNEAAHEQYTVHDYAELGGLIPAGHPHYVVIMTFGYRTDDLALRALLDKEFTYLGVLGSAAKMQQLLAEYRASGIPEELLQRVQAPAGLAIKSQTPAEIAVSIAAGIIAVKNKLL